MQIQIQGGDIINNYSTEKRKTLINLISKNNNEIFTANQLVEILKDANISKSAIYRNLNYLEKEEIICRVSNINSKEILYRYTDNKTCSNIIHLICDNCNKTLHLDDETSKLISDLSDKNYGFKVNKKSSTIKGICKDCENHTEKGE